MKRSNSLFVLVSILSLIMLMTPGLVYASWYADLYLGGAVTEDNDLTVRSRSGGVTTTTKTKTVTKVEKEESKEESKPAKKTALKLKTKSKPEPEPEPEPAAEDEETAECPECEAVIPITSSSCPKCGIEFEGVEE